MKVLVMAAHPDDEVLGCGGTITRHVSEGDEVQILIVADGETARIMKAQRNRNMEALKAAQIMGAKVHFLDHPDQRLDQLSILDLTRQVEIFAGGFPPEIVYTHHSGDANEDHRIVRRISEVAFRPLPGSSVKQMYAYEVLSSTEWGMYQPPFVPDHFVTLTYEHSAKKLQALAVYNGEMRPPPHPRNELNVSALMQLRGSFCGANRAEAFMTLRHIR